MSLRTNFSGWVERGWYDGRTRRSLLPFAALFAAAVRLRRAAYRSGLLRRIRVPARLVVVGNVVAGGSGKTPLVAWLAQRLAAGGVVVGIVTRGYGGNSRPPCLVAVDSDVSTCGDEALWLARATGVPVIAGRDRAAAARRLIELRRPQVILADDGLQHYRLARDMEIATVDAARGFGNGALLPAGPLREPLARLAEVAAIVLKGEGEARLPAGVPVFRMNWRLGDAVPLGGGERRPLAEFRGRPVRAVAAIADPEGFFHALERAGLEIRRSPLPDHAPAAALLAEFERGETVLMTEKDAVKVDATPPDAWQVPLEVAFSDADAAALLALVRGNSSRTSE